jgi:hypothetical protein
MGVDESLTMRSALISLGRRTPDSGIQFRETPKQALEVFMVFSSFSVSYLQSILQSHQCAGFLCLTTRDGHAARLRVPDCG